MAPIKFEEQIKEKLENRRIQPSKQGWNKLSERLEAQEKSKNSTPYWWLGIAASIIGVLFVVSQFWNNNNKTKVSPMVVDTQEKSSKDSIILLANESIFIEDFIKKENDEKDNNNTTPIELKRKNILNTDNIKEAVSVISKQKVNKQEDDIITKPVEIIKENLSFEDQQIKDVVAKVEALKNDNKTVTEDDIDALLLQAQKEIRLHNLINKTTGVVDANLLLQDVEADLDQSFRSKVFEALKSSYTSVKTAIAQRNN